MTSQSSIQLRPYHSGDAEAVALLFTETVHSVNARDYPPEQLAAWAPQPYDLAHWRERLERTQPLIAQRGVQVVGFGELAANGHIDCFYVHKDHQGSGVGRALLGEILRRAQAAGLARLYTEASLTAIPFFKQHGFRPIATQQVALRGQWLTNMRMEQDLAEVNQP
ncbi:MAG: GNAT family N-acetyltransferase [Roseiflexaceae bacterium]